MFAVARNPADPSTGCLPGFDPGPSATQVPISGVPTWPRRYCRCRMRCLSPLTRSAAAAGRAEREQPRDGECSATDTRIPGGGVMARGITAAALIASVVIGIGLTAPAFAKHGNGNGGGHGGGGGASFSGGYPSGFTMGQRSGWNGGSTPPGWSHGNKTGWRGRGMPPGLYKKYYSNSNRGYSNRYSGSSSDDRGYWYYYGSPGSYCG